jgi:hypothetical protein
MKFNFFLFFTFIVFESYAQNDTLKKLNFTGHEEMYYSYDFSNPQNHEKSNFLYNLFHSKDKICKNELDNYSLTTNMTIKL